MSVKKKMLGEERRLNILSILKNSQHPVTGNELASIANVSRQIIVGDITLLKAHHEPIMATSNGYIYLQQQVSSHLIERTVACFHGSERTEEEMLLIVDQGVTLKDVKVEHPLYGDLTASIMVSNRSEVQQFIEKVNNTKANLLSKLTDGTHIHTLMSNREEYLDNAIQELKKAGFLIQ